MLYILGLGNPGIKYHYTRHNVAWLVFESLCSENFWKFNKYMNAEICEGLYGIYIKPQTFMNNSGEVVAYLKKHEPGLDKQTLVVVYDDIDLPLGTVRVSFDRGDGGHNGLKSITEHYGSKEWIRIRIGVSKKIQDKIIKPNVLGLFPEEERIIIQEEITPRVEQILKTLFEQGLEKTMNIFNTK